MSINFIKMSALFENVFYIGDFTAANATFVSLRKE